jgi:branched-chain amino acid transport system permease protein
VILLIAVIASLTLSSYGQFLGITAVTTAMVAMSVGIVTGRTGMISLCQMSFAALGEWALLWLNDHAPGMPFLVDVLISGLVMIPISLLVSLPALRLRGILLAVITIAFASTVVVVITNNNFPGENAGVVLNRPGWLISNTSYLRLSFAIFALFAVALWCLDRTSLGATWRAVNHSERAAAALGRSVAQAKLISFALSAFIAGVAGALVVGQIAAVTIQGFSVLASLTTFAIAIMVAAEYPEGALLAGIFAVLIPYIFQKIGVPQDYANLLFAVGAVLGLKGGAGAAEGLRRGGRQLVRRAARSSGDSSVHGAITVPPGAASLNGSHPGATPDDATQPALKITTLSLSYGRVRALDDVSLSVPARSVVALIGPNGAGKSTLIDCVSGFLRSYSGEITVAGARVDSLVVHRRARAGIRRSFQQDRTVPQLTVERYVRLSMSGRGRRGGAGISHAELRALLNYFDCPAPNAVLADVDVGTRRLVEVAAAVAARPAVVLLDEPAAGLPAAESARLAQRIAEIPYRFGSSVLLVEHDMELVAAAASEVVVLDFGKVIAAGPPAEVLNQEKVISAYLGAEVTV